MPEMTGEALGDVLPLVGLVITGAAGAVVSTVNVRDAAGLLFPPGSVAVASIVWLPFAIGRAGEQLQVLPAFTNAVHSVTPFSLTVTVLPASAVPPIVGVLSFVALPTVGDVMVGVTGATLSTSNVTGGEVSGPT